MTKLSMAALILACLLSFGACAQSTGSLTIHFAGMKSDAGSLVSSLVDSADSFLARDKPVLRSHVSNIKQRLAIWEIESLPFGYYAISAYHDTNNNGELDSGLFGIPTEDYGFSNNARGSFGPPNYAEVLFEFNRDGQVLNIWIK